jgi:hypothetical protein
MRILPVVSLGKFRTGAEEAAFRNTQETLQKSFEHMNHGRITNSIITAMFSASRKIITAMFSGREKGGRNSGIAELSAAS